MAKQSLIFVSIFVFILIVFGLTYYLVMSNQKFMAKNNFPKEEGVEESNNIVSLSLMKFIPGSDSSEEKTIETLSFNSGDLIRIEGEIAFAPGSDKVRLTYQVLEEENKLPQDIDTPELEIETTHFGSCCIKAPDEKGRYLLKVFLDDQEKNTINFEVK